MGHRDISESDHLKYIKNKGRFKVDCSLGIFSKEEINILEKYGHWFTALCSGDLLPITDLQHRFIKVIKKELDPFSVHEWAWLKYTQRKQIEVKYKERLNARYVPDDDTFYSRPMVKQVKKIMYKEMKENHKL